MANAQLLEYMKAQSKSFKKEDLLAAVRKAGWQESAIQEVLREMEPAPVRPTMPVAAPAPVVRPVVTQPVAETAKPAAPAASSPAYVREPIRSNPLPAAMPVRPAVQASPVYSPAVSAVKPMQANAPTAVPALQPTHLGAKPPIMIDATGNALAAGSSSSPAIRPLTVQPVQKPVSAAAPAAFGVQQMPQMRREPIVAKPLPIAKPFPQSSFPKPEMPVQTPSFPAPATKPAIAPAEIAPQAVMPSINLISDPMKIERNPAMPPVRPLPPLEPRLAPAMVHEPLPTLSPKILPAMPAAQKPAPLRINPAFIPGAASPAAFPKPVASPVMPVAAESKPLPTSPFADPKPILAAGAAAAIPGAFQGMRVNSAYSPQAVMPVRSAASVMPLGMANPALAERMAAAAKPRKTHRGLIALLIILLMAAAAGAFIYLQYPAAIEQAQLAIQSAIPGAEKAPGEVLGTALTKLANTSRFRYSAKVAGSVVSAEDASAGIGIQGTLSGDVASVIPFPESKNSLSLSLTRSGATSTALKADGEVLTSPSQGMYFRITDVNGSEAVSGGYSELENIWVSVAPSFIGADKFQAIFGSQGFQAHQDQIRDILLRSQIIAIANVFPDDGSGLYHYALAIQKDKILPTVLQVAQVIGSPVSDADRAQIANDIQSATFPGLEVWITKDALTMSRIKAAVTRKGPPAQSFTVDISLLPLVGNPPSITAPDGSITLEQALGISTSTPAAATTSAKKK